MKREGELRGKALGECSHQLEEPSTWGEVWKLALPPRVKLFLWKCLQNVLPTKVRLWYATPWTLMTTGGPWQSLREWWTMLSKQLRGRNIGKALGKIACMLWSIWKARNVRLFENKVVPIEIIVKNGQQLMEDFSKAESTKQQQVAAEPSLEQGGSEQGQFAGSRDRVPRPRWQPPDVNSLKCNCDGRWQKESLIGTTGGICRDSEGVCRGVSYRRFKGVTSPLLTEPYALREGLHLLAWKLKCRKVDLESDSKTLVHILKGEHMCPDEIEVVVADIVHLTRYMEVTFHFVKRALNNVAHTIAHWEHHGIRGADWLLSPQLSKCSLFS
ncbi:hypothetical protein LIER_02478 [Lithospermum erythrorhizon]|uniref:RNase H type-1 domain-containing protein n=1 Tax=Lithospermum erythrorhizon TaxID=34254 RepID=A0AAV3NQ12_LITER